MTTTSFLFPDFKKSEKGKVNNGITVPSKHVLVRSANPHSLPVPAIASEGFSANRDGTYVFCSRIDKIVKYGAIHIGFTSTKAIDEGSKIAYPGLGVSGVGIYLYAGEIYAGPGDETAERETHYLPVAVTDSAKEVVAILTISNNQRSAQFIVDGNEGSVIELASTDFENKKGGNGKQLIYPIIALSDDNQKIEMIPFDQVKSRSPKINKLMKEFATSEKNTKNEQKSPKKAQIKKTVKKVVVASKPKVAKKTNKNKTIAKKKTAKKATKKAGKKISKK